MKPSDGREEILRYVERHGVRDKDAGAPLSRKRSGKSGVTRNRKGGFRKTIDLHGMVSIDAERELTRALNDCVKRGIRELLIIHGKGTHSDPDVPDGGVLKKMVRDNLEFRFAALVRRFGPALPREGGDGATVVTVR